MRMPWARTAQDRTVEYEAPQRRVIHPVRRPRGGGDRALVAFAHLVAAVAGGRGYWFDEMYMLAVGRNHLDWGSADQPPVAPLIAWVAEVVVPGSVLVLRIPAIVATVAAVVVVALIARELGGDRRGARRARAVRLGADVQQRRRGTDRREHRGRVRGSVGAQPNRAYGYFPLPDESSTDVLFTGADPFDLEPYFTEIREVRGPVSDDIDARVWLLTGRTTGWHEIRQQIRTLDVA